MPSILRRCFGLVVICVTLALAAGCAGLPSAPSASEQAAAANAQRLYAEGNFDGAAAAWIDLADHQRGRRDGLLLKAAESYRQEDAWDKAAALLDSIRARRLAPDQAQHLRVLQAEAAQAAGDNARALDLTADAATLAPAFRARALETRARAQLADNEFLASARTRLTLNQQLEGYDRSQNQDRILAALGKLDPAALNAAANGLAPNDPMKPWLAQALAKQGSALAVTLPELNSPVGTLLPGSTREGYAPPHRIALLLPLGGPLAPAASAVRDGFLAAHQADPETASVTITEIDTGDTVASALAAYQQAASVGADIAVGPLSPDAVAALFQQGNLPLPVLALNHPDSGVPPARAAEFALPPEAEGAQVASHMHAQGLATAIVFASQANWAERATRAFQAQFRSLGGQVIATATLDPSQVNYASIISAVLANADQTTGIFLAVDPNLGRLLVPQLRIAQITEPLFATSHIYAAETNPGLDRDLDGVTFCDAPWLFNAQPGLPRREDLAATTPTTVGPAARLFAFGMDAYDLLPYLAWLRTHPHSYLAGATGQLTMDSFGRILRTPIWVQFVNGIATTASGSLDVSAPTPPAPTSTP